MAVANTPVNTLDDIDSDVGWFPAQWKGDVPPTFTTANAYPGNAPDAAHYYVDANGMVTFPVTARPNKSTLDSGDADKGWKIAQGMPATDGTFATATYWPGNAPAARGITNTQPLAGKAPVFAQVGLFGNDLRGADNGSTAPTYVVKALASATKPADAAAGWSGAPAVTVKTYTDNEYQLDISALTANALPYWFRIAYTPGTGASDTAFTVVSNAGVLVS